MADSPPPLNQGRLHALSWWSLGLTIFAVVVFVAGFVIAANVPPHRAEKNGLGDFYTWLILGLAPISAVAAFITGVLGVKKRGNCLSVAVLLGPPLVIVAMVLFLWLALWGLSGFR